MRVAVQCACGEPIPDGRLALGYRTCLACGQTAAREEQASRARQIVPTHHKGGLTYVSPAAVREHLQQVSSRAPRQETATYETHVTGPHRLPPSPVIGYRMNVPDTKTAKAIAHALQYDRPKKSEPLLTTTGLPQCEWLRITHAELQPDGSGSLILDLSRGEAALGKLRVSPYINRALYHRLCDAVNATASQRRRGPTASSLVGWLLRIDLFTGKPPNHRYDLKKVA